MKKQLLTLAALAGGFVIGASALVAMAQTWTPPSNTPPTPNVAAPINVGVSGVSAIQEKYDSLRIDGNLGIMGNLSFILGGLNIVGGNPVPNQSVLTATNVTTSGGVNTATVGWGTPTVTSQMSQLCSNVPGTNNPTGNSSSSGCPAVLTGNSGYAVIAENKNSPGVFDATTARNNAAGACSLEGQSLVGYTYATWGPPGCGSNLTESTYNGSSFQNFNVQQCGNAHVEINSIYCSLNLPANLQK